MPGATDTSRDRGNLPEQHPNGLRSLLSELLERRSPMRRALEDHHRRDALLKLGPDLHRARSIANDGNTHAGQVEVFWPRSGVHARTSERLEPMLDLDHFGSVIAKDLSSQRSASIVEASITRTPLNGPNIDKLPSRRLMRQ